MAAHYRGMAKANLATREGALQRMAILPSGDEIMDIQTLIDQARPGDTVRVPEGVYAIDAVNAPITLKSDIKLDLTGVTLQAIPNDRIWYRIIEIYGCSNVTIIGGLIIGERDGHLGPTNWEVGGGGAGINIAGGSHNIVIRGTHVSACFADGILVLNGHNITISYVECDRNRRQGMSIINCDGLLVQNSQFSNNGGTPPGCGIDLECDLETEAINDVLISACKFFGNEGSCISFGSPGTYTNCRVAPDNDFDMRTQPIWAGGNAAPLGTPWWAFVLNRLFSWWSGYRWWGYRTEWHRE
jgi:Right handed beta helix region